MITLAEVKVFLQINDTGSDALITALIPSVQSQIIEYCNYDFATPKGQVIADTIAFAATGREITDSESGFVTGKLGKAGYVSVSGSVDNDGVYKVDTVAAGTITLDSGETLVDESAGESVTIKKVEFPADVQKLCADMIGHGMNKAAQDGITSEKLGDYAVTYANSYASAFPGTFMNRLNQYRRLPRD